MVVVSIISVLSISAIVGFGGVGSSIHTKQTAAATLDLIKKLELEVLTGWYESSSLTFEQNYLVAVSQLNNQTLSINWEGIGESPCEPNEGKISWGDEGELIKSNAENVLSIKGVGSGGSECIYFTDSSDDQWSYQLKADQGNSYSSVIRLTHFELNRQNPQGVTIDENEYEMLIESPYAKKALYQTGAIASGTHYLTFQHPEGAEEIINIQN